MFWHALAMIFRNFGTALKISVVPIVLMIGAGLAMAFLLAGGIPEPGARTPIEPSAGAFLAIPAFFVVFVLLLIWMIVAWHRAILLDEKPGLLAPRWNGGANWTYFKNAFLYFLFLILAMVPLGGILFSVIFPLSPDPGPANLVLFYGLPVLVNLVFLMLAYRLGPLLPAAALQKPLSFGEAWTATSGITGTLLVVSVLTLLLYLGLWTLVWLVAAVSPTLASLVDLANDWLILMFGISILTTLYGHFVEKRPL